MRSIILLLVFAPTSISYLRVFFSIVSVKDKLNFWLKYLKADSVNDLYDSINLESKENLEKFRRDIYHIGKVSTDTIIGLDSRSSHGATHVRGDKQRWKKSMKKINAIERGLNDSGRNLSTSGDAYGSSTPEKMASSFDVNQFIVRQLISQIENETKLFESISSQKVVLTSLTKEKGQDYQTSRAKAAAALGKLAVDDENKVLIGRAGGIQALVKLLYNGSETGQNKAAAALWTLALNEENKRFISDELVTHNLLDDCVDNIPHIHWLKNIAMQRKYEIK